MASPSGLHNLSVPPDVALGDLVQPITEAVGVAPDGWVLATTTGQPLPLERTVQDLGLAPGSIVRLLPRTARTGPAGADGHRGTTEAGSSALDVDLTTAAAQPAMAPAWPYRRAKHRRWPRLPAVASPVMAWHPAACPVVASPVAVCRAAAVS